MAVARIALTLLLFVSALAGIPEPAYAEPYLAVREGLACSACHADPGGGGMRTAFGNAFAEEQLPASPLGADAPDWSGLVAPRIALGANARAGARQTERDDQDDNLDFGVDRVTVYLGADLSRAFLYVDQQVAPGGSLNRQAWGKLDLGNWYVKAGRMFLPFGWRLEDDGAFVREVTGVTMTQGDDGVEVGFESGGLSWQLAAANGNGGGPEIDDGKLFTTRAAFIRPRWQAGLSAYRNDTDEADRTMFGAFLGLHTGPVTWLAELDQVEDDVDEAGEQEQQVALLEANVMVWNGHNLKLTAEGLFPDDDAEQAEDVYRFSAVYEYFPWAFTQVRLGVRALDSDSPAAELNGEEAFVQLHLFF